MINLVVWIAELVGEVVVATVMQFFSEVFVGWAAEIAETVVAEWLTALVADMTQLFTDLVSGTRR